MMTRAHATARHQAEKKDLLSGDLDELLHQLHALAQLAAEQDLRGHPQLDLIAALQQEAQVHCVLPAPLPAEREVDQLLLQETSWVLAPVKLLQTATAPQAVSGGPSHP